MKLKLFLICMFLLNKIQAQTVLIPNGGFDTNLTGWNITGTDVNINLGVGNNSNALYIDVPGLYTRDFELTSTSFSLEANKTYKLHLDYRNIWQDQFTLEEVALGGFTSIFLKNNAGNTITTLGAVNCANGYMDSCHSVTFTVPTSGIYFLEFHGQHNNTNTEFILDNVGFEEVVINSFSGNVLLDVNNDNCVTSSMTLENFPVQLNENISNTSYLALTDFNGDFNIETTNITGNFITQINHLEYNSFPTSYFEAINGGVNAITGQNFCINPNSMFNDVLVSIIPTTEARPGFNSSYEIQYTNLGTTTLSGVVNLNYNNNLVSYLNASVLPNVNIPSTLEWNYSNLTPFETRTISVQFNISTPPTVNNGDVLNYTTLITPTSGDATIGNNTFVLNQITVGSYDPNDITILEGSLLTSSQSTDYLNMLIRFQNTGTASAINVVVNTELDVFLDWTTFEPIAASHNYSTIVNNENKVSFVFNGINLADSTADEQSSHGWVYYKIKPKNTFAIGDVISSVAQIYFDYNLPIITNTAITQIEHTLSTTNHIINNFKTYPSPVKDLLYVLSPESGSYQLLSIQKQIVKKNVLKKEINTINISHLAKGIYFLVLRTTDGISIQKILKQ